MKRPYYINNIKMVKLAGVPDYRYGAWYILEPDNMGRFINVWEITVDKNNIINEEEFMRDFFIMMAYDENFKDTYCYKYLMQRNNVPYEIIKEAFFKSEDIDNIYLKALIKIVASFIAIARECQQQMIHASSIPGKNYLTCNIIMNFTYTPLLYINEEIIQFKDKRNKTLTNYYPGKLDRIIRDGDKINELHIDYLTIFEYELWEEDEEGDPEYIETDTEERSGTLDIDITK